MYWVVLIASGVLEACGPRRSSASKGFRRPWPVVVFAVSMTSSVVGLAWAMRGIPVGTAYAAWVGVGAVLTVLVAVLRGEEKLGVAQGVAARRVDRLRRGPEGGELMHWVVLLGSAVLEAVWATALSEGAYVLFLIAATLSMVGLSFGMKRIPVGTAYAVWVGIGAALTVTWAMITGAGNGLRVEDRVPHRDHRLRHRAEVPEVRSLRR